MVQTTQRLEERLGRAGSPADVQPFDSITRVAEDATRPGNVSLRGDDAASEGKGSRSVTAPDAADADAIVLVLASAAAPQNISGAGLDGVIGAGVMLPPRNISIVFDASTDWDPTTGLLTGEAPDGSEITEEFAIATSTTFTGTKTFRRITNIFVPTQTGAGGTATVGTGTRLGELGGADVLGLVRYLAARELDDNATAEFAQFDILSIITGGRVWVETETVVVDGDPVFVRLVISGMEVLGAFLNVPDGTLAAPDAVRVLGMRFHADGELRDGINHARVQFDMTPG